MGPKKGKKKTKAELEAERLQREEDERKARELEAKRAAEDAERLRQEELKLQIQRNAERELELERLRAEYTRFTAELMLDKENMKSEALEENEVLGWIKYKDPMDEPDARNEKDINTFLSLARDFEGKDFRSLMTLVGKVESAALSIASYLNECIIAGDNQKIAKCRQYLNSFHELMLSKVDVSTNSMLRFVESHLNEKLELQFEEGVDQFCVGLYGAFAEARLPRKNVIFDKMGAQLDLNKQITQHEVRFIVRVTRVPIDRFSSAIYDSQASSQYTDLIQSNKYVIGNIFIVELLYPPPSPVALRARNWVLRDCSGFALSLRRAAYPSSVGTKLTLRVPENILVNDSVRVAVWREDTKVWSEEGTSMFEYLEADRKMSIYTVELGAFAWIRDRNYDLPFRRWSLAPFRDAAAPRSLYEKMARLHIQTQHHELTIEILGTQCRLTKINCSAFDDILGTKMSAGNLLFTLQRRGLNLMYHSGDVEGVVTKMTDVEADVLTHVGRCASSCEFCSSSWNQQLSHDKIGILVKESTVYTGAVESFDFECVVAEKDCLSESCRNATVSGLLDDAGVKYTLVMGNEYNTKKEYSMAPRPDEITHVTLVGALQNRITEEARERIDRVNGRFAEAIASLLKQLRLFSMA